MTLFALVLTAITGFQVTWNVEPAREQNTGSVLFTVTIDEGDLLFVRDQGLETASWEVVATIDGDLSVRNSGSVLRSELPVMETFTVSDVASGSHLLRVTVGDLETGRDRSWEEEIEVPLIDIDCWSSGTLQFPAGTYLRASGTTDVLWNVYSPVDSNSPDSVFAAYILRDGNGVTSREGWMDISAREGGYECTASIYIGELEAGEYDVLSAVIVDNNIVAASIGKLDLLQAWDVWGDDPDLTRTLVRPIATSRELRAIGNTEGPSSRNALMAEFWQKRDPTTETPRNEFLEEYLIRLDYIEENFAVPNTLGINTDTGRVYALLGEPDIIEYRPLENYSLPSQIWTYFTPPTEVAFADFDGFGEFELVTDWEEVWNAWERH